MRGGLTPGHLSLKALILAASELQILDNGRRAGEYKLVGAREVCISFIKVGKVCCVLDELLMDGVYSDVRVVKMIFFLVCYCSNMSEFFIN